MAFTSKLGNQKAQKVLNLVYTNNVNINPFTSHSAKSKIDKFSKITNWVKINCKTNSTTVLRNSFPMNGRTWGLCPQNQKLENYRSPKDSLWESKG